jgi:hypothetical protein
LPCPVCDSVLFATEAHVKLTDNTCRVCGSEWTDWWDDWGNLTAEEVTKNTRAPESAPNGSEVQPLVTESREHQAPHMP